MPRVALTDRFVAGAKADSGKRASYFDSVAKGLELYVTKADHRAWSYHYTLPSISKRARVALGTYPATSLAAARAKAVEAKGLVEDGLDPRDVFAAETAGALTVAGLIQSYLGKHVRPNLRSAASIERRFDKNVLPVIGTVRAADLHRREVNRVIDVILARVRRQRL